jgi:hypothetical protein
LSRRILAYSDYFIRNFMMPSRTNDAGVSPGCTLEEMKIVGLSKIKGLESGSPLAS